MKIFFNTFKLFKVSFSFDQIHNTYQLAYFLFENMKMKSLLQVLLCSFFVSKENKPGSKFLFFQLHRNMFFC